MSKPAEPERCAMCGHPPHDGDTCVVLMCYCTQALKRPQPEAASEVPAFNKNADAAHVKGTAMYTPGPQPEAVSKVLTGRCQKHANECQNGVNENTRLRAALKKAEEARDVRVICPKCTLPWNNGFVMNYNDALVRRDAAEAALKKAHEGDVQRVRDITKFATERDRARERVAEMGKALREIQICCGGLDGISGHDAPEDVWGIADAALRSLRGEK